jgi:hypothetical protein
MRKGRAAPARAVRDPSSEIVADRPGVSAGRSAHSERRPTWSLLRQIAARTSTAFRRRSRSEGSNGRAPQAQPQPTMSCRDDISRHSSDSFWMADPIVRRRIGERVSETSTAYPIVYWRARCGMNSRSAGCFPWVRHGAPNVISWSRRRRHHGVDTSLPVIEHARNAAAAAGIADRVRTSSDAHDFLARTGG